MKPKPRKKLFVFCGFFHALKEQKVHHVSDIYAVHAFTLSAAKIKAEKKVQEDCEKTFPLTEGFTEHYSALGVNLTGKVTLTDKGKEWTGIK